MNTYLHVLRKYAIFSGRASRKEYWVFYLYNFTFSAIAIILDNILRIAIKEVGYGPIYLVYILALLIPSLAVTVRRLHDIGKSGWMILIALIPLVGPIWLIVLLASKSSPEKNRFGDEPADLPLDHPVVDEIILIFTIWMFLSSAFYAILPRVSPEFFSSTFQTVQIYMNLLYGAFPLALALVVKNKPKKILLLIIGGLILLYYIYVGVSSIL